MLFMKGKEGSFPAIKLADMDTYQAVTATPEDGFSTYPVFSPNGRRMAFMSWRTAGVGRVYTQRLDGSAPKLARAAGAGVDSIDWAPDGTLYESKWTYDYDPQVTEIFGVRLDGSSSTQLTDTPGITENHVRVSPDGTKVLYVASGTRPDGSYANELMVMNSDGSGAQGLGISVGAAIWRPDGCRILASVTRKSRFVLVTMRPDGSDIRRFPIGSGDWVPFAWQPWTGTNRVEIEPQRVTWRYYRRMFVHFDVSPQRMRGGFEANLFRLTAEGPVLHRTYRGRLDDESHGVAFFRATKVGARCLVRVRYLGDWNYLPAATQWKIPCKPQ